MKFIKILLIVFVVSCIFAVSNASAMVRGLTNITIPSFKGISTSTSETKLGSGYQYLQTTGIRDDITGELRKVEARTKTTSGSLRYSTWKKVNVDSTKNWGNENNASGTYSLQLRSQTSTIASVHYFGIWYFDN